MSPLLKESDHMAARRLAGGASNIEALTKFVSALASEDAKATDAALEAIQLKDTDFGRGYMKALAGMRISLFEKNVDSLIFRILKGSLPGKQKREIMNEFRRRRNAPFVKEYEKGFHAAWKDVLRILEPKEKSD